jgi:dipeptide/tripeptide permease
LKAKKIGKHEPNFLFSANLSKIYTKKTLVYIYRSFRSEKEFLRGEKRIHHFVVVIGPIGMFWAFKTCSFRPGPDLLYEEIPLTQ